MKNSFPVSPEIQLLKNYSFFKLPKDRDVTNPDLAGLADFWSEIYARPLPRVYAIFLFAIE